LVPVTMQTFAVLAVGAAFGMRLAAATLVLYVMEGTLGLPVFQGFAAGPAVLIGPTGGYLIGFDDTGCRDPLRSGSAVARQVYRL
jgi:biotin transport system substrate-specific component